MEGGGWREAGTGMIRVEDTDSFPSENIPDQSPLPELLDRHTFTRHTGHTKNCFPHKKELPQQTQDAKSTTLEEGEGGGLHQQF